MSDIPEWAKQRAYALSYQGEARFDDPDSFMISRVARAFARYISEHEEPPVDPLMGALRHFFPNDLKLYEHRMPERFREHLAKRGLKIVSEQS